jgi:hypothetical protein
VVGLGTWESLPKEAYSVKDRGDLLLIKSNAAFRVVTQVKGWPEYIAHATGLQPSCKSRLGAIQVSEFS